MAPAASRRLSASPHCRAWPRTPFASPAVAEIKPRRRCCSVPRRPSPARGAGNDRADVGYASLPPFSAAGSAAPNDRLSADAVRVGSNWRTFPLWSKASSPPSSHRGTGKWEGLQSPPELLPGVPSLERRAERPRLAADAVLALGLVGCRPPQLWLRVLRADEFHIAARCMEQKMSHCSFIVFNKVHGEAAGEVELGFR